MTAPTPGRLRKVGRAGIVFNETAAGFDVGACEPAAENARRLVACWNACMGLSTEQIELLAIGATGVKTLIEMAGETLLQRDELMKDTA